MALVGMLAPLLQAQQDLTDIPPADPEIEKSQLQLWDGAAANLFAGDPQIRKPIQMNFDGRGQLWVASSEVYPQVRPGELANDKIIVLADKDGDGVAETRTVFADGLLIPTAVIPDGNGGALVANSTELLHLEDRDGDGISDVRRVVLSGFGTEDTHHLLHTFRWAPDGWLYMNQSIYIHSHIETPYGTRRLNGGGIWRYKPSTGQLEVFCKGFVNPWGHTFTASGRSLVTDGAYFEGINYAFPDAVFVTSPGATRWLGGLNPGSPKHCGLEIASGPHIPSDWQGDLLTNDFRSHRVCRFTVRPSGSGFTSKQQPELITTQHVAFRPIDVRMGPDGAIYIADWYNPIIQHGEVDFRDERRDRTHGRIWRVSFPGRPAAQRPDYENATIDQLLGLLESDALWERDFARIELGRRDVRDVLGSLDAWIGAAAGLDQDQRRMEAMWLHERFDQPSVELISRLAQRGTGETRAAAIRQLGRHVGMVDGAVRLLAEAAVADDPLVRLEAVAALGRVGTPEAVSAALAASDLPLDASLEFALWNTVRSNQDAWAAALAEGDFDWGGRPSRLIFALSAAGNPEAGSPVIDQILSGAIQGDARVQLAVAAADTATAQDLGRLLQWTLDPSRKVSDQVRAWLLNAISQQAIQRDVQPDGSEQLLNDFARRPNVLDSPVMVSAIVAASGRWKAASLSDVLISLLKAVPTDAPPAEELLQAVGALELPESKQILARLARDESRSLDWRTASIEALARVDLQQATAAAIDLLQSRSEPPYGESSLGALLRYQDAPAVLSGALEAKQLSADVARAALREAQNAGAKEPLLAAIRRAGRLDDAGWKMSPELTADIVAAVKDHGDPERGEAIYRRENLQCIKCHAIADAGGLVGPNLVSIGGSAQVDYLLESLIDPNAKIKENFHSVVVLTDEAQVIQGIVQSQDDTILALRDAEGEVVKIPRERIEQMKEGQSLMPTGLIDSLTRGELVDLVRFLSDLGRTPEFTVSPAAFARSFATLVYTPEANRRLNRTSVDTAATDDPAFRWKPITAKVDGSIPLDELPRFQQHRSQPPTSFLRVRFQVPPDSVSSVGFSNVSGIQTWVDTAPTPTWELSDLRLSPGEHVLTVAIDQSSVVAPLRCTIEHEAALQQ